MNNLSQFILKKREFEKYLQYIHAKEYLGTDDDMPDAFEAWLGELDTDQMLQYGDSFLTQSHIELLEEVKRVVEKMGETNPLVSIDRNDGYEIACDDILKKLSKAINEVKK